MRPNLQASWVTALLLLSGCGENLTRDRDPVKETEPPNLSCVPNLDGQIDSDELQAAIGVPASYLVSPPGETRDVNLKGTASDTGAPIWDMSQDFASDQQAFIEASKVSDHWFKSEFPAGEFAAPADAAGSLLGVYQHTDEALYLLGIASKEEDPKAGKTLLVYNSPIALYKFPLIAGTSWIAVGEVQNGTAYGLPYAGKDTYEIEVGPTGQLELFDYTFEQVHRVKLHVVQEPSVGQSVTTRQSQFLFECFGEVARAVSKPGETKDDFTQATEVRRLGQ
ncbi:MAG: hypothetical protein IPK82_13930 [Polyangiaceae bacterium]|nr:hypothetical protein [Polyangiaceae bacterium]